MKMKNILITGGCGFIGSHTCVQILKEGIDVCIIDSLINSSEKTIYNIEKIISMGENPKSGKLFFRKGDLRDISFVDNVFKEFLENNNPFEFVIHFAALKSVEKSVETPLDYYDCNLNTTLNVLKTMDKFKCNNFIFSSSATVYDPNVEGKFKENSPRNPVNPYGNTKLLIEKMLEDISASNRKKWKIANLRYFNPVGAHESGLIGENSLKECTNLFPEILKVASGEKDYLSIFGKDWPTPDGTCIRDYIHVVDLADAHLATMYFLLENNSQIISINIGTGQGLSVKEIVDKFIDINKVSIPYTFVERRKGDPAFEVADNSLALKLLNWSPKKNIDEMCSDALNWLRILKSK